MKKKLILVLTLSLVLMMAFAATAMAAQNLVGAGGTSAAGSNYAPTPKNYVGYGSATNYPNGIYLPYDPSTTNGKIHSGYQANTDACASCHATHTGVGKALLQWATISDTCNACHDGTITATYDVNNGKIGTTTAKTFGGEFSFATADTAGNANSMSRHNVEQVNISAAPGGNSAGTADANGQWGVSFECTSCHSPHGQGNNFRILSPDPNGIATQQKVTAEVMTADITNTIFTASKKDWIMGYPYTAKIAVYDATGVVVTTGLPSSTVDYRNGKVTYSAALPAGYVVKATYYPGIHVTGTVTNKLLATEDVQYTTGVNAFCGACHTDYNTNSTGATSGSADALTGTYTKAYRHQVGMNWHFPVAGLKFGQNYEVECLTCHVAHGTNNDWWTAWAAKTGWNGGQLNTGELAGSSALKRLPNMSACEACHGKGAASNY